MSFRRPSAAPSTTDSTAESDAFQAPAGALGRSCMVYVTAPRCLFLLIRGGEGYSDVPVQDAQGNTSQRVFEVIFCGQAVVEACVCFGERFQKKPPEES